MDDNRRKRRVLGTIREYLPILEKATLEYKEREYKAFLYMFGDKYVN